MNNFSKSPKNFTSLAVSFLSGYFSGALLVGPVYDNLFPNSYWWRKNYVVNVFFYIAEKTNSAFKECSSAKRFGRASSRLYMGSTSSAAFPPARSQLNTKRTVKETMTINFILYQKPLQKIRESTQTERQFLLWDMIFHFWLRKVCVKERQSDRKERISWLCLLVVLFLVATVAS